MRHSNPSGELSVVVERALDVLLAKLEKQRLAKVACARPGPLRRSMRPGYVPRSVRREVFERDGARCTFVDASGRRCESRTWLELDHRVPRALRGADDASNLSVRCRAHNRLSAEEQFGREHMDRKAGKRRVGGDTAGEAVGEKGLTGPAAAVESGAGARGVSTGDPRPRSPQGGEICIASDATRAAGATPAPGADCPRQRRQRGYDEDDRACPRSPQRRETRAAPDATRAAGATPVMGADCPRQRGRHEDERQPAGDDLAFRALCGMGFRAHEARRALGVVGQRRAGSPPAAIETLLREALAVLAP
jgi:hypothetical protein